MIKQAAADHPGRGTSLQLRVLGPDDGCAGLPAAALAPPPAPLLPAAGGAGGRLLVRAANDPSVLTITEKAPTRAFSCLKALFHI